MTCCLCLVGSVGWCTTDWSLCWLWIKQEPAVHPWDSPVSGQKWKPEIRKDSLSGLAFSKGHLGPPYHLRPYKCRWSMLVVHTKMKPEFHVGICRLCLWLVPWWCPQILLPQCTMLMWVAHVTTWDHVDTHGLWSCWEPWVSQRSWYSQRPCWCPCDIDVLPPKPKRILWSGMIPEAMWMSMDTGGLALPLLVHSTVVQVVAWTRESLPTPCSSHHPALLSAWLLSGMQAEKD